MALWSPVGTMRDLVERDMAGELSLVGTTSTVRAPRRIAGRMPPGCRTIQVFVPESVHFDLQAQAGLSRMDVPDYVYWLLTRATPCEAVSVATKEGQ